MSTVAKVEPKFKDGDRIRIQERDSGTPDPKALTYYPFYKNLSGKVIKSYPDNTVAIEIDRGSLPEDVRLRHEASEQSMRDKWLGGLGEEEREKLSEKHKNFSLRYTLLLNANDVEADDSPAPRIKRSKPVTTESDGTPRKTAADIEAAEQEYLRQIQQRPK